MAELEQIKALTLFNEKAVKLESCSFSQIVFAQETGVTCSYKEGEPLIIQRRGPNDEAIDAFVLTFRFFIQDNEKSSFRNMATIYESLPISEEKKEQFRQARNYLNDLLDSNTFLRVDGEQLSYRRILFTFVYGGLSHANENRKNEYDKWINNPFSVYFIQNEFIYILGRIMKAIMCIRTLNIKVIEELKA